MCSTNTWCDDERCTLGINMTAFAYPMGNKYMVGEEWILREIGFDYKHLLDEYDLLAWHDNELMIDSDACVTDYDDYDDAYIAECDDEVASVASSEEHDRSFDWLFTNNKFMYT
jgi:hypothetical protein